MTHVTTVAVGVLMQPDGRFLLASRPEGKPYAGYWEFPGGKIEPGETLYQALVRELQEELGITVRHATPWLCQHFTYPHATVALRFFLVRAWDGALQAQEGQQLQWQGDALTVAPVLPANMPVLRALSLPPHYGITCASEWGTDRFLPRLAAALDGGLRLIQLRDKTLPAAERRLLAEQVIGMARAVGARVLINDDAALARASGADGVHLSSAALQTLERRPDFDWVGASVHDMDQLRLAAAIGVDYAVLGPVLPTRTHPDAPVLGWDGLAAQLAEGWPMPVYALGGMQPEHLAIAQAAGAHGVAMMRAAWGGNGAG
jgi:8-oxo-dGTP diphosphatase